MTLAITILTGGRPNLLRKTLTTLVHQQPELREAPSVALVNGGDQASIDVVTQAAWIDRVEVTGECLPIGRAVTQLMAMLPAVASLVLHMEDDWRCVAGGWLHRAKALAREAGIGQVRLRANHSSVPTQRVSRYHMVTKTVIKWRKRCTPSGGRFEQGRAHFTFNPSICPVQVWRSMGALDSEQHAARQFFRMNYEVAQLLPGVFLHEGHHNSLRERLHR